MQANVTRSPRSDCYPTFLHMSCQQSSLSNDLLPVVLRLTCHRYFSLASQGLMESCHISRPSKIKRQFRSRWSNRSWYAHLPWRSSGNWHIKPCFIILMRGIGTMHIMRLIIKCFLKWYMILAQHRIQHGVGPPYVPTSDANGTA